MFKRKNCPKCRKETSNKYDFCPYCGIPLDNSNKWGMLGKNDFMTDMSNFSSGFNLTGGIFNKMIGNAMKMMEKELQKEINEKPKTNFQLFINGKKINLGNGNVKIVKKQEKTPSPEVMNITSFSKENQKKFTNLEKHEPATNVRRLADRVIYEVEMPGVKSVSDISIKKLENSIELKAIARNKAYFKIIQVNFPVIDYSMENERLILELGTKSQE